MHMHKHYPFHIITHVCNNYYNYEYALTRIPRAVCDLPRFTPSFTDAENLLTRIILIYEEDTYYIPDCSFPDCKNLVSKIVQRFSIEAEKEDTILGYFTVLASEIHEIGGIMRIYFRYMNRAYVINNYDEDYFKRSGFDEKIKYIPCIKQTIIVRFSNLKSDYLHGTGCTDAPHHEDDPTFFRDIYYKLKSKGKFYANIRLPSEVVSSVCKRLLEKEITSTFEKPTQAISFLFDLCAEETTQPITICFRYLNYDYIIGMFKVDSAFQLHYC